MTSINPGRSEGDTWDLANSVGATATGAAVARALASKGPDALLDDPFADPLVRAVGLDFFVRMLDGDIALEDGLQLCPQAMIEQIAVRTRFFDDFLTSATDAGIRQAVILASGLDARAYRLRWPVGTVVFEIDQPQVMDFKARTMADLGAASTAEHRAIGMDLRDDWREALQQSGFEASQPTAWIAEGLLVYLPPEAQDQLFDDITAISAPGSRVATENFPDTDRFSDAHAEKLTERLRRVNVALDMAQLVYHGERRTVIDDLAMHGWEANEYSAREIYARNGMELRDGDEFVAAFANASYVSATLTCP